MSTSPHLPTRSLTRRLGMALGIMLIGGLLASCATRPEAEAASPTPVASSTAAPEESAEPAPEITPDTVPAEGTATVRYSVTGSSSYALIRDVMVTEGDGSDRDVVRQALPYESETVLTADQLDRFYKLVLFAKNIDGQSGDISCTITVNGEVRAQQSQSGYRPVTCLVVHD
ncbi:hypothetical protein [Mycetocola spongiae]|uniref:hypothetical protein n=1 Tax=Mycetocola spongiae TaxID=2859226 RepID=UPI001CF28CE0|nr:hypothetical protein [Mycetocola spongiae]UCR87841.1 hypothetical protein KXZ72_07330 [Mycetocola spongiae]